MYTLDDLLLPENIKNVNEFSLDHLIRTKDGRYYIEIDQWHYCRWWDNWEGRAIGTGYFYICFNKSSDALQRLQRAINRLNTIIATDRGGRSID